MNWKEVKNKEMGSRRITVRKSMKIEIQEALPAGHLAERLKAQGPEGNYSESGAGGLERSRNHTGEESPDGQFISLYWTDNLPAQGKYEGGRGWMLTDDAGGYREQLYTIVYPEHFDRLKAGHMGFFTGADRCEKLSFCASGDEILKTVCRSAAAAITGVMPGGISLRDLEALICAAPGGNCAAAKGSYENKGVMYAFFVNGYDVESGLANSVGGLSVEYDIQVAAAQEQGADIRRNAESCITARFVSYSDMESMERDMAWLSFFEDKMHTPPDGALEACLSVDLFHSLSVTHSACADAALSAGNRQQTDRPLVYAAAYRSGCGEGQSSYLFS